MRTFFFEKEEEEEEEEEKEEERKKIRTARDERRCHVAIKAIRLAEDEGIKNYENSRSGNWQRISEAKRGW